MRPIHLNIDRSMEDRDRRIYAQCQGFILKKFRDPNVSIEQKTALAEKIYLKRVAPFQNFPAEMPKESVAEKLEFLTGIKI